MVVCWGCVRGTAGGSLGGGCGGGQVRELAGVAIAVDDVMSCVELCWLELIVIKGMKRW